jgi:hypothetical protein
MDNIIFSVLAYLPITSTNKINDLEYIYQNVSKEKTESTLTNKAISILEIIHKGKRFKNVIFCGFTCIVNDETQFGAITYRFQDNCYVAFRGTDNSLIGWKENFDLSYMYPVNAQKLAAKYLNSTINSSDKNIYVGGHSKGGNLAMVSAMECQKEIFNRIKFIYNNDGPGFLENEFNSEKYNRICAKLKNFLPEESMVGILLNNKNYNFVKSKEKGIYQHDLTSWLCFGPFLIDGHISSNSLKLKTKINSWLASITDDDKKTIVITFFSIIKESKIKYLRELRHLKLQEILAMINEAKNVNENDKEMLKEALKMFT